MMKRIGHFIGWAFGYIFAMWYVVTLFQLGLAPPGYTVEPFP